MSKEEVKKYWLEMYREDKIGTIAKLSQAMQHMAWLREWQRVHGDAPRIKPITKKVNGKKVKVGEADIAVPWSKLHEFFRAGNEYGDIETVKFLAERIESGDVSALTEQELHDLSERENVKWSDGKHTLNPFQGYLYDFMDKNLFVFDSTEQENEYGKFYPLEEYKKAGKAWKGLEDFRPNDSEDVTRSKQTYASFQRYYTTRLMQELIKIQGASAQYRDFADFDITSVTTPEQITELDKKLAEIVQSPAIQAQLEVVYGNKEYEKAFYDKLRKEVEIEIKKDSDRIENAYKVFVALETGNLDELFQDPETDKCATEEYNRDKKQKKDVEEKKQRKEQSEKFSELIEYIVKSDDPRLDELCWIATYTYNENEGTSSHDGSCISVREAMLREIAGVPQTMNYFRVVGDHEGAGWRSSIHLENDVDINKKMLINVERKKRQEKRDAKLKTSTSNLDKVFTGRFSAVVENIPEWMIRYIPELKAYRELRF